MQGQNLLTSVWLHTTNTDSFSQGVLRQTVTVPFTSMCGTHTKSCSRFELCRFAGQTVIGLTVNEHTFAIGFDRTLINEFLPPFIDAMQIGNQWQVEHHVSMNH